MLNPANRRVAEPIAILLIATYTALVSADLALVRAAVMGGLTLPALLADHSKQDGLPLASTVLKVAHHGAEQATTVRFLEAVTPQVAVVSVGAGNRSRHPAPEVLERLEEAGVQVWRTDGCGDVEVVTDGERLRVRMGRWEPAGKSPGRQASPALATVRSLVYTGHGREQKALGQTEVLGQTRMRFHYGPVPEDAGFAPEAEGWLSLREPGPVALQLIALPVAFGVLLFCSALLYLVFPSELLTKPAAITVPIWPLLAILVLLAPVHEGLHALAQPHWGASPNTGIGLWLSRALLYAHYEGPMSRNRFLLVGAAPFLVLSLLPIGIIALLRYMAWTPAAMSALALLSILSILGGVLASGDLVGLGLAAFQIPATAVVRNKGWRTYWKKPEQ